jgi:tetratricopeptide (TPR) repeat protein
MNGPTPVPEALERCREMRDRAQGDRRLEGTRLRCEAHLEAMLGNFEHARALIASAISLTDELGLEVAGAGMRFEAAEVELLAGMPTPAEAFARSAVEILERIGNHGHYVTVAPILADALLLLDRDEEADEIVERVIGWAIVDDLDPQIAWRRVRARVLARRNDFENAERLARESIELAGKTDFLDLQARSIESLAEVLRRARRSQESLDALDQAAELYEQKGNIVATATTRALQDDLRAAGV